MLTLQAKLVKDKQVLILVPHYNQNLWIGETKLPHNREFVIDISDKDNIKNRVEKSVLIHYADKNGKILNIKNYDSKFNTLRGEGYIDKDSDFVQFDNLDDEYAYKKFVNEWKPVYETAVSLDPVKLEVIEVTFDTGSPYINPLWTIQSIAEGKNLYRLNQMALEMDTFTSLCGKHSLLYEIPNHSHLRFAKIEGKYVFDDKMDGNRYAPLGDLESLKALEKSTIERITKIVLMEYKKKTGIDEGSIKWPKIYEDIQAVRSAVYSIDCKTKSYDHKRRAMNIINDLVSTLEKKILES